MNEFSTIGPQSLMDWQSTARLDKYFWPGKGIPASSPMFLRLCSLNPLIDLKCQVGAAISMTYTTGQPIVFVGTGQTYSDLKSVNVKAVVNALLRA